jgi:hypothetical protein
LEIKNKKNRKLITSKKIKKMAKRTKVIYFVTMVIKYTEVKHNNGIPMRTEKITIFQKSEKMAQNGMIAHQKTLIDAQKRFSHMRVIAYSITELVDSMFDITEEDEKTNNEIIEKLNQEEKE